ncbi:MMPL family transporter [Sciscionella marina]|uniref:MMPL family transporter n=1 Tax=Sciscionella marina TaxID=508770 RepID=UPI000A03E07E|nr:efflux RND transporter permease subunit [Sciscionella marina]
MSSFLYRLGRAAARARWFVLAAWLVVLILVGGSYMLFNKGTEDNFTIPGSSAQDALDHLNRVFPQVSGSQGQAIVVVPKGMDIHDPAVRTAVSTATERMAKVDQVTMAGNPFDKNSKGQIAKDNQAALIQMQINAQPQNIHQQTKDELSNISHDLARQIGHEAKVQLGGNAFNNPLPQLGITEVLGVIIALIVLLLMFRSFIAAGMPLLTALIGVGIGVGLTYAATAVIEINSTAPLLGIMLGLAVGIDYALFILSRHRDQLGEGLEVRESIGRATATAGSAVIFAGTTVMIALIGLFVAGIPFLTVMGMAAAFSVAVAVLVAVTLIPALLAFAGEKLRPRSARPRNHGNTKPRRQPRHRIARGWVKAVTKVPALTVVLVIAGLGVCALPASDLTLSLPNNGQEPVGTAPRDSWDTISEHFGPGFNAPLMVTANIVGSHDPIGVMNGIADEVRDLPGVAAVPISTPNATADTGIMQVVPDGDGFSEQTKQLVTKIRSLQGHFQDKYGVSTAITGITAVALDVSDQLAGSLLPFGILVVGLSLILLAMVFRSIWVPIKAAAGYLLSVLVAFGATSFVFVQGHFADLFNIPKTGSVISFLPILLMGVLFGLAMDYEVFLVTRIREEFVHKGDPRQAIETGFISASRVVTSAAIIMFAVFAAFVPEGNGPIKPMAFSLAIGVFVDAFIVRMILVPAVLALLGKHAWWLPRWLERRLPVFDAEGDGLMNELRLQDWPSPESDDAINAARLRLGDDRNHTVFSDFAVHLPRGGVLAISGPAPSGKSALLYTLAGRVRRIDGDLKVLGNVLPQRAHAIRRRVALIPCRTTNHPGEEVRAALRDGIRLILLDDADLVVNTEERAILRDVLSAPIGGDGTPASVALTCQSPTLLFDLLPAGTVSVDLGNRPANVAPANDDPTMEQTLTIQDAEVN